MQAWAGRKVRTGRRGNERVVLLNIQDRPSHYSHAELLHCANSHLHTSTQLTTGEETKKELGLGKGPKCQVWTVAVLVCPIKSVSKRSSFHLNLTLHTHLN